MRQLFRIIIDLSIATKIFQNPTFPRAAINISKSAQNNNNNKKHDSRRKTRLPFPTKVSCLPQLAPSSNNIRP